MGTCELLTSFFALTSTRGSARRRGTTDAWPLKADTCRGVWSYYRDRGTLYERRGARRLNKEWGGVREYMKRRGVIVGDSETPSSSLIKKNSVAAIPIQKNTT